MTTDKARRPQAQPAWTVAQKAEMDGFLNELAEQARKTPQPTLAQRSLAMARQAGQQMAREDAAAEALLEMRPNAPPANPFSLELYMDGLIRRLNRGLVSSMASVGIRGCRRLPCSSASIRMVR